jgi:hypothetical protein
MPQSFTESGLFLIGTLREVSEVKSADGRTFGLYTMWVEHEGWKAKADFEVREFGGGELTRLGQMYEAGEMTALVGKRIAVRVQGRPAKASRSVKITQGEAYQTNGYVNYRAVTVVSLEAATADVEDALAKLLAPSGTNGKA